MEFLNFPLWRAGLQQRSLSERIGLSTNSKEQQQRARCGCMTSTENLARQYYRNGSKKFERDLSQETNHQGKWGTCPHHQQGRVWTQPEQTPLMTANAFQNPA
jgi:hypothetical protein